MRFDVRSVAWAIYTASLLSGAQADADASSKTVANKPEFTPTTISGAPFLEQFTDDWKKRWTVSAAKKDDPKSEEDWAYVGEWEVEEPYKFKGIEGDKGLVVKSPAAHHAISAVFPKKINNKGKTLVVQYEVKLQDGLECGGAYMKLLQDNKKLHAEEFSNSSPYMIMFGPDKCGATNKIHFIIRHKNPKTGEYEEKHLKSPPAAKLGQLTNLYTLIVKPDQTFQIKVNGESLKEGSLLEDFQPPFNPEKEIDDPKDSKPDSWVDEAKIADPEAKKPDDWDEDAPFEIPDEEAIKPADWLDDEPLTIPDPEAVKPEDWDDDEDGDWIAPKVPNPKCEEAAGCGKWERPTKRNPEYKGKWSAPMIDNPAYKGVWAPRKIKNPDFFEDKTPSNLEPMGAIGFEIWTMQKDILFDNIYIGHSIEEAESLKTTTYDIKKPIEESEESLATPEPPAKDASEPGSFKSDPIAYIKSQVGLFVALASINPIEAVKAVPEVAAGAIVLLITVIALAGAVLGSPDAVAKGKDAADKVKVNTKVAGDKAKAAADKAKETAAEKAKDLQDAAATGADKAAEATKRTTRSSKADE